MMSTPANTNSSAATNQSLNDLWQSAMRIVKGRVIQPSLWRAMEQLVPLTIEDDTLVMGLSSGMGYHASQLASVDRRTAIEAAIAQAAGRRLSFRVIEGDTLADWESVKQREAVLRNRDAQRREIRNREKTIEQSWESVTDDIMRVYSKIALKQLPQNRAAFFWEALPILVQATRRLLSGDDADNEVSHRACARLIDKIASLADLPPSYIGVELQRALKDPSRGHHI
jgi:hypothetical protein